MAGEPVALTEVWRSGVREGCHRGHAVVLAPDGSIERAWGDPTAQILPRSANKPGQASAMVRAGLPLIGELLALSAASHSGEPFHIDGARRILAEAGIAISALGTPADYPLDEVEREQWLIHGKGRESIAMNCSGKHSAMLLTCAVNGWPLEGYTSPDHPLQVRITAEMEDLSGEKVWATAVDGCGAPLHGLTLTGLARLAASCGFAEPGTAPRAVADAMREHPEWVAGTRRDGTALARAIPGLFAKEGAEAVYMAALPDGRAIALKIDDGADRARPVAMAGILLALGVDAWQGVDAAVLQRQAHPPLLGGGRRVGELRPTPALMTG